MSADTARVPQREFQAVRAYRAAGADGDGLGRLVPGLGHVVGHGKPVVRIDGRTGAPGLPVHPPRVHRRSGRAAHAVRGGASRSPAPAAPPALWPASSFVAQSSSRCRWSASPDQLVSRVQGLSMSGMPARGWRRQGGVMDLTLGVPPVMTAPSWRSAEKSTSARRPAAAGSGADHARARREAPARRVRRLVHGLRACGRS